MLPGEAADEPDLAWPYRHPELPWLWTHWRTSIRACVCVCLLYAQKKQLQQYASHCLLRLQFRYGRCCCLFRMQFYGQRTPCIPLPASLVSSTSYVVATASASSRHILTPQKYATRAFCLLKILHFAFCSAKLIWSAFLPAFAMDSVLVDWSGHHFNYNGHLRPHPDPHLAVLIQALDRNQAWVRAGFGFYCIRINNCIGHKCGGRGWDSSIAIIYISLGQQQKATQHALNKLAKLAMCFGMSVCLSVCVCVPKWLRVCICVCYIVCNNFAGIAQFYYLFDLNLWQFVAYENLWDIYTDSKNVAASTAAAAVPAAASFSFSAIFLMLLGLVLVVLHAC